MSVLETIAQKVFGLVTANAKVAVTTESKIACASPQGEDPAGFGPWASQEVRQVSFEADAVTTAAVEIDFRIIYKTSAASQYLDEVFADSIVKVPVPYSLDAKIEFQDASVGMNADGLEMAIIPFLVTVTRSHPLFGIRSSRADGELHGDGDSTFGTFETIDA